MSQKLLFYYNSYLSILLTIFNFKLEYCQINDDFKNEIFEEGNYSLLDITDYHNIKLIVTTSKNIYTGLPPLKRSTTDAKLINTTSIMTINKNYLLAACLEDSLLTKININTGISSNLVNYADINIDPSLKIPITICSLSSIDNTVFIGYSRIEYYETMTNKTNIVIKLTIKDKDSNNGPNLDTNAEKKVFIFPKSTIISGSQREISCEPLKIKDTNKYRLVCLYEDLVYASDYDRYRYYVYSTEINETFNGFEKQIEDYKIYRSDFTTGFRIYKIDDFICRTVLRKRVSDIKLYINIETNKIEYNFKSYGNDGNINKYMSDNDLFEHSNGLVFAFEKNNTNYYTLKIVRDSSSNYFILYDYKENIISKILCYYEKTTNYIIILYQCPTYIKYYSFFDIPEIYGITSSKTKTIKMKSYENIEYDVKELLNIANFGNLNVEIITRNNSGTIETKKFGIDFNENYINNNIFTPEKSFNTWYKYNLSLIDNKENYYTRIYHLNDVNIIVSTCYSFTCTSCWNNYDECDDCTKGYYAFLIDDKTKCYPKDKLLKGYIYSEDDHIFKKCYHSCDFCSSSSENNLLHNCYSCAEGYLLSYADSGNCYKLNNLQINEDKNNDNENFISASCSKNKINDTGECIENCPTSSNFYNYEYDTTTKEYIQKENLVPPKYLFNKKCYKFCPLNSIQDDDQNICKCQFAFHTDNNEKVCYSDLNCISEYTYQNPDTKECYLSLNDCIFKGNNYFFNKYCYKDNCPNDKVKLSSKNTTIQNYYINNLLLDNNLGNSLCICDTSNKRVWINITSNNEQYFQECLDECPDGYQPEPITSQCLSKIEIPTTTTKKQFEIIYPEEYYKDPDNCQFVYDMKCLPNCPNNTCITQEDPLLLICVPIKENVKVYNYICFENLDKYTDHIKALSDNNTIISKDSGITIHAYSTNNEGNNINIKDDDVNYSLLYLRECENRLREYYKIPDSLEIFILGIDSPNKDKRSVTPVYNYEVYLENGTQLDYSKACLGTKVSISSPISNTDLIKFNEALYFSGQGYDIYNNNNRFYNDYCAPAFIDGNDITLEDRKNDFSISDISLCNRSCDYMTVDFVKKRFNCECDPVYNFSNIYNNIKENDEDLSYFDYYFSFINYNIILCYKLLKDIKNYYFNGGFYIGIGSFILSLCGMIIFLKWGIEDLNKHILKNIPNKLKLMKRINEKNRKIKKKLSKISDNPPIKSNKKNNNVIESKIKNINIHKKKRN